mgnify:CR=1 FL=1
MVKQPVHKKKGVDFDANNSFAHNGLEYTDWWNRCKAGSGSEPYQDKQLMNIAAVNLLPKDFERDYNREDGVSINTKDKIKYIMKPGEKTGLKCFSS